MDIRTITVGLRDELSAKEAARILRVMGSIEISTKEPGDPFPYDIGDYFEEGEGCITYTPHPDGGMRLTFTPFEVKERVIKLEERIKRLEMFCSTLREGFPQLANVVSYDILKDAASHLGPI